MFVFMLWFGGEFWVCLRVTGLLSNFSLVCLARVSGANIASELQSVPSFRYVSKFWVHWVCLGSFASFACFSVKKRFFFILTLRCRLRQFSLSYL